ncbi:hypothetical protein [Palleronia caenipelagi]|uniref:hypothetical protein n=1 Tax=Palleronia caenipelagi TaxID=2489174 RepID=UPI00163DAC8F|nr:hypothetical protein [Palleronia caenipelagi]
MGYVDETGWHYVKQSNKPVRIKPGVNYTVTVAINGNNVTVAVAGVNWFSYDYTPQLDSRGDLIPMNAGMVGVGMDGSRGRVDNFAVQILPPDWTLDVTDDFIAMAELPRQVQSMAWMESSGKLIGSAGASEPAVQTVELGVGLKSSSVLEMEVDLSTAGSSGFIFDRYGPDDYKFIALDTANDAVILGHATAGDGRVTDASFAVPLDAGLTHHLQITLQGAGATIRVDGVIVAEYEFNLALVDGGFGVIVFDGSATFDNLRVATDDDAFNAAMVLSAQSARLVTSDETVEPLDAGQVEALYDAALEDWAESGLVTQGQIAALADVELIVTVLEGASVARATEGGQILLDVTAAGAGWFLDWTPETDDDLGSGVDMLTVLRHEIGHLLGDGHGDIEIMDSDIDTATRIGVDGSISTSGDTEYQDPGVQPTDDTDSDVLATMTSGMATILPSEYDDLTAMAVDEGAVLLSGDTSATTTRGNKAGDRRLVSVGQGYVFDPATGTLIDAADAELLFAAENRAGTVTVVALTAAAVASRSAAPAKETDGLRFRLNRWLRRA